MESDEIKISDWQRILMGENPPVFLLEVLLRTFFIYLVLMVSMRLIGKRIQSTLSIYERVGLISLAGATGMGLQVPERGLLPIVIVSGIVIGIHRTISYFTFTSKKFEMLTHGDALELVRDGVIQLKNMRKADISKDILCAELRDDGIDNLGKVRRVFVEASGALTNILYDETRAGLSIIPKWDVDYILEQKKSPGSHVCRNCGYTHDQKDLIKCPVCKENSWDEAVIS